MSNNIVCLKVAMVENAISSWNYLLQKGFALTGVSGMSVRSFLREVLCFDDAFIESTVRTVFLNNSPVDDLDETCIKEGDRMALGSAMPGLVGIVMGRDNPFKSFRSDIDAKKAASSASAVPVTVSMKVFSTLAVEVGRDVLKRGILVDPAMLAVFLADKKALILEAEGNDADAFLAKLETMVGVVSICVDFS